MSGGNQTFDLRTGVHVVTAIEAPCLDLLGKTDGCSVCECSETDSRGTRSACWAKFRLSSATETRRIWITMRNRIPNATGTDFVMKKPMPTRIVATAKATQKNTGSRISSLKAVFFREIRKWT